MKAAFIIIGVLFISTVALSATIWVPDNYATIQGAIDASSNGDVVIVRPGTYVENIDFVGKAISVRSEQGATVTTIDGNKAGSVVTFQSGEGRDSVLEGFSLSNGDAYFGGGIHCNSASPTIANNTITANTASSHGGGISCRLASSPSITNNTVTSNTANGHGGGIYCFFSSPPITNNTVTSNTAIHGGGIYFWSSSPSITNNTILANTANLGGGIYCDESSSILTNNTISANTAIHGAGGICCSNSSPTIINTVLWTNTPDQIKGGNPDVSFCDVQGGWPGTGNIDADPLLRYGRLTFNSPCKDAGTNSAPNLPAKDIDGDPRIAQGTVDIGADEFYYHLFCNGDVIPGGTVEFWFTGFPTQDVKLGYSSSYHYPPLNTTHGPFYLTQPLTNMLTLPVIRPNGVIGIELTVPSSWIPGEEYYFQAMLGPWWGPNSQYSKLTNPLILTVE